MTEGNENGKRSPLFPRGTDFSQSDQSQILEIYKLFVKTSEDLVVRRQTVNAFFISINTLLLSAIGLVARGIASRLAGAGIVALASAGILVCYAWTRLVESFRQLNTGKFRVIGQLEKYLAASVFEAEWQALAEGKDPKVYRPFTATEPVVAFVCGMLYVIAMVFAVLVLSGVITL